VLVELALHSLPCPDAGRPVRDTCGRLDGEERPGLRADRDDAQPRRGEEVEAQMAADALVSEND